MGSEPERLLARFLLKHMGHELVFDNDMAGTFDNSEDEETELRKEINTS